MSEPHSRSSRRDQPHCHETLPFVRLSFPFGIPIPFWKKTVDCYYITVNVEEMISTASERLSTSETNVNELVIGAILGLVPVVGGLNEEKRRKLR